MLFVISLYFSTGDPMSLLMHTNVNTQRGMNLAANACVPVSVSPTRRVLDTVWFHINLIVCASTINTRSLSPSSECVQCLDQVNYHGQAANAVPS